MSGDNLSHQPREAEPSRLEASEVEAFLYEHPAFLQSRPELLLAMDLPHGGAGAVSLVERQVNLLRERNIEMRNRLATMTRNAEKNDALFEATRAMVIALLDCRDAAQLTQAVEQGLLEHFGIEYAMQLWFTRAARWLDVVPAPDSERAEVIERLLKRQSAFCGIFREEEMAALFPGCSAEGSAALAPLIKSGELIGAVAVGSKDTHRYNSQMGTLFLEHLAEVITRLPLMHAAVDSQPMS